MILLPSLPNNLKNQEDYHYFLTSCPDENSFLSLGEESANFLKAIETSLHIKKGLFIIFDKEEFLSNVDENKLKKHFYIHKKSWIYLSCSLKKHINKLDQNSFEGFDPIILDEKLKKLFSD